jgi:serine/threonine-protein kinase
VSGFSEHYEHMAKERVGSVLKGKWTLDELLGVGGMAAVYAATHRNKNRVAIKMLHPELSLNPEMKARFLREGYVANSVGHEGAVTVQDDDTADDGSAFLVMDLVDGQTLHDRRADRGGSLPAGEVIGIVDQLLDVLVAAHAKGVLHRDIKPENLLVTRDGKVKVLDFGIARLREMAGNTAHTRTGVMLGTPAYMAPEQAASLWEEVDERSDLWSVAATMFTLLVGHEVHVAETLTQMLAMAVTQPARRLAQVLPQAHPALAEFVDKALAFDKNQRFQSAREMQEALRRASELVVDEPHATSHSLAQLERAATVPSPSETLGGGSATTTRPDQPGSAQAGKERRRWSAGLRAAAAIAVASLVIGLGVGFVVMRNRASHEQHEVLAPPPPEAPSGPVVDDFGERDDTGNDAPAPWRRRPPPKPKASASATPSAAPSVTHAPSASAAPDPSSAPATSTAPPSPAPGTTTTASTKPPAPKTPPPPPKAPPPAPKATPPAPKAPPPAPTK